MTTTSIASREYSQWLVKLKTIIKSSQTKAALSVNSELVLLYWNIGKMIMQKQIESSWGSKLIEQVAQDLQREFPGIKGFSRTNLIYCKKLYSFYSGQPEQQIGEQAVHQLHDNSPALQLITKIPWGHNIVLLKKVTNSKEALYYVQETISNNWSRNVLSIQIDSRLYERKGKAITNFKEVLSQPQADLLNETLKSPYIFDFLTLEQDALEKDIQKGLMQNITKFILELGKGFAFLGQEYRIDIEGREYYLDLLFYHVKLRCYVVIELKAGEFKPEYIGKLNYYLSAVDSFVKDEKDAPTIGILLCKGQRALDVEFALRGVASPIGVSEFSFEELPLEVQRVMPSVEELERELLGEVAEKS